MITTLLWDLDNTLLDFPSAERQALIISPSAPVPPTCWFGTLPSTPVGGGGWRKGK